MSGERFDSAEPIVDPFLEPWSLADCEEVGVEMGPARACHDLLRSGLTGAEIYETLYRQQLENSYDNNQQTHIHLADTLIRVAHVYEIDKDTIQGIAQSVHESLN